MKLVKQQNFKHKVFGISLADLEPLGLSALWLASKATKSRKKNEKTTAFKT